MFLCVDSRKPTTATVCPFGAIDMSLAANGNGAEKYIACLGTLEARHHIAPKMAASHRAATTNHAERRSFLRDALIGAAAVCEELSAIHFNSPARSRAVCQRSSGSFARQRRTT